MPDAGCVSLVATPIGNLEDITLRALRVLREADLIAAEDTRRTRRLLSHYHIRVPVRSYHAHSPASRAEELLCAAQAGQRVAVVTDAGSPGISDPGRELAVAARTRGIRVEVVPGPSALIAALSASGMSTTPFVYLGYPPRKRSERERFLARLRAEPATAVLFEAPHRLRATLEAINQILGPERLLCVARELTKLHEEVLLCPAQEAAQHFAAHEARGEVTIVVEGCGEDTADAEARQEALGREARRLIEAQVRPSEAARQIAEAFGISRNAAYRMVQASVLRRQQSVN